MWGQEKITYHPKRNTIYWSLIDKNLFDHPKEFDHLKVFDDIETSDHLKAFDHIQALKEEPEEYNCEH